MEEKKIFSRHSEVNTHIASLSLMQNSGPDFTFGEELSPRGQRQPAGAMLRWLARGKQEFQGNQHHQLASVQSVYHVCTNSFLSQCF